MFQPCRFSEVLKAVVLSAAPLLLLFGCGTGPTQIEQRDGAPEQPIDVSTIPDAVPKIEPYSRYGNPPSYVVNGKRYFTLNSSKDHEEQGIASWYGTKFHGRRTSSGEPYDLYAMTAAHRSLPLPTYARITNLQNGRSVILKINDRGPFHPNRIIDLSYAAAAKLGIMNKGTGLVKLQALDPGAVEPIAGTPVPAPTIPPSLFIQVGAFGNSANAKRLQQRLSTLLPNPVRIQEKESEQQPWFRVRIGPLDTVEQADALTLRLTQLGIMETHIVIK